MPKSFIFGYLADMRSKRQFQFGNYYFSQQNWQAAVVAYSKGLALRPEASYILLKRAWAYSEDQRPKEALADVESYLSHPDTNTSTNIAAALNLRSQIRFELSDLPSSLLDISEAIRVAPLANYHYVRATILFRLHQRLEMVADLRRAAELAPKDPLILGVLARILSTSPHAAERNGQQALVYATTACQCSAWKDWKSLSILAAAHAECGDFPNAVLWAQKSLDLAPLNETEARRARLDQYRNGLPCRDDSEF